ncbi:amidase signature domain-containing protein [Gloeopeniophorella convolvens]|nr:amidase signature domain-containing protein [Gloeopeniophorella convolvens]
MWPFESSARPIIDKKLKERADALASASAFQPEHKQFTDATATQIVQRIKKGEWTAVVVVEAYIARAAQAHAATNCLTEILFDDAREVARELDRDFAATGKLRGPLHGVPFSLKDLFDVAGYDGTIGYTQWANKPATSDSVIYATLKAAGGVLIAKTNVPQTMLAFESVNPLWGRTLNPWSAAHTSGGSSGGEGALLAADGSALGMGTDIGGSIRTPSGYCGIYGLKPGHGRISCEGARDPNPGFQAIDVVSGPLARSVADLELAARVLFGARGDAQFPPPIPYLDVELPQKLRFAYYLSDGLVKGSPACQRAVLETVEKLRGAGHECIEFQPPEPMHAMELFTALTSADGYKTMLSHLGPDKKESALFLVTLGPRLPSFVLSLVGWVARTFVGDEIFARLLSRSHVKPVRQYYDLTAEKLAFERRWRAAVWGPQADGQTFDAILAPVQALPAVPHGGCDTLSPLAAATILYNIVDSPVGVVPVTRVDAEKDALSDAWRNGPGSGSKLIEKDMYGPKGAYNPKAMHGLPVGIQIVGRPWEEERVLAMMHVVDDALGPRGFGPGEWEPSKQTGISS